MSKLACPYCYESFAEREIRFRCSGKNPPTGDACRTKVDKILNNVMGDGTPKYPHFDADGRKREAECPQCHVLSFFRICPRCHMQLPVHFGKIDSRMIAMIGAKEAGKTVFMTVLLHELMNRMSRRFGASVLGADEETRKRFQAEYERSLYIDRHLPDVTRSHTAGPGRQPLVFTFAVNRTRFRRNLVRRSTLSFFDTAGEDLSSEESVNLNTRYLASADGIILLLDPLQMRGARSAANEDTELPPEAANADMPQHVLGRVIDLLDRTLKTSGQAKIKKPIAVAFSKMDALTGALPPESPLLHDPDQGPWFDETDSLAVHSHMQELLQKWHGGALNETLSVHFERYRLCGLSALGNSPVTEPGGGSRRVSHHGIQPIRVEDPFLWMMSEFGIVPKKTARRG